MIIFRSFLQLCMVAVILATDICDQSCCSPNWLYSNDFCYRFFISKKNWQDARHNCLNLGADLTSIHSAEENNIVSGLTSGAEV